MPDPEAPPPPPLRVLSTLALAGAMRDLALRHEAAAGGRVEADFAPTVALLGRIRAGEAADVALLTAEGIDELASEGLLRPGGRVDVALSRVGVAVRAGAPRPDIGTVAAFRAALLEAPSVAYSRVGASGTFFAGLIERLGIAEEVNAKARIVPGGFTAELAARGEVSLAVQQVSELLAVPGIDLVGPLPPEIQTVATFSAAPFLAARDGEAAERFLRFLGSPDAAQTLRASGLDPPDRR